MKKLNRRESASLVQDDEHDGMMGYIGEMKCPRWCGSLRDKMPWLVLLTVVLVLTSVHLTLDFFVYEADEGVSKHYAIYHYSKDCFASPARVLTLEGCTAAAKKMHYTQEVETTAHDYYPAGCYCKLSSEDIYFNTDGYTHARYTHPDRVPLCDQTVALLTDEKADERDSTADDDYVAAHNGTSNHTKERNSAGVTKFMTQEADTASALGTLNLVLGVTFFFTVIFFVLRKLMPHVYVLRNKQVTLQSDGVAAPDVVSSWLRRLIYKHDEDIIEQAGFDAYMMLRLPLLGLKFCCMCLMPWGFMLIGVFIYSGQKATELQALSMANIPHGDPLLWFPFGCTWLFSIFLWFLLYKEENLYCELRRQYHRQQAPEAFTVMVRDIPKHYCTNRKLKEYFEDIYPGKVHHATIAWDCTTLKHVLADAEGARHAVEKQMIAPQTGKCCGPKKTFEEFEERLEDLNDLLRKEQKKVLDVIRGEDNESEHAERTQINARLQMDVDTPASSPRPSRESREMELPSRDTVDISRDSRDLMLPPPASSADEGNSMDMAQSSPRLSVLRERASHMFQQPDFKKQCNGFVCFKDMLTATVARQVYHDIAEKNHALVIETAPKQESIRWNSFAYTYNMRVLRGWGAWAITGVLTIFWAPPVIAITALTSIDALTEGFPFMAEFLHNEIIAGFITGTLPALILTCYMSLLPQILAVISKFEGHCSEGESQRSVSNKHYFFLLLNVLLVSTVSNSFMESLQAIIHDPTSLDDRLGEALPKHSTFFVSYTLLNGLASYAWYLSRLQFVVRHAFLSCGKVTPRKKVEACAPEICRYDIMVPKIVLMIVICITFSAIAPVILLIGIVTFAYVHNVLRYLLLHVYEPANEEGGELWDAVCGHLLIGLAIFQLTCIGLLTVKGAKEQVLLAFPLPFLTLIFNWQLSSRFARGKAHLPLVVAARTEPDAEEVDTLLTNAYVQPSLLVPRLEVDLNLVTPRKPGELEEML